MDQVVKFIEDAIAPLDIEIMINAKPNMKFLKAKPLGHKKIKLPVFSGDDSISGIINIKLKNQEQPYEHMGIKCTLVGHLQIYDEKQLSTDFHSLSKELEPVGKISKKASYKFKFPQFQKQYESYYGVAGQIHYFIRVTVHSANYLPNTNKQISFAVMKLEQKIIEKVENQKTIKMQIGVGQTLSIFLEYQKNCFHLKDCIVGRVIFHKLRIQIAQMQLWLIRFQTFGVGKKIEKDKQVLIKYELMDGCPEEGDIIPVRLFLNGVAKLTPSYINIHNRLSVNYGLSLVIRDRKGKKYFKQADIILHRKI